MTYTTRYTCTLFGATSGRLGRPIPGGPEGLGVFPPAPDLVFPFFPRRMPGGLRQRRLPGESDPSGIGFAAFRGSRVLALSPPNWRKTSGGPHSGTLPGVGAPLLSYIPHALIHQLLVMAQHIGHITHPCFDRRSSGRGSKWPFPGWTAPAGIRRAALLGDRIVHIEQVSAHTWMD